MRFGLATTSVREPLLESNAHSVVPQHILCKARCAAFTAISRICCDSPVDGLFLQGQQDAGVLQHQQCYCRYALHDSNTPAQSWRSRSLLQKNASSLAKQSRRAEAAQHSPANFSPFQAVANCRILPEFPSSPSASPSEADAASLAWEDCLSPGQSLISSPDGGTGLQDPQLSVMSTNDLHFHQVTSDRHTSTPVSQVSQDPYLLEHMDTALSTSPQTLSPHTSLSMQLPALSCPSVVQQSAMSWIEDSCPMPSEIRLQLTSAPAMFAQPVGINKAILPAFQVLPLPHLCREDVPVEVRRQACCQYRHILGSTCMWAE